MTHRSTRTAFTLLEVILVLFIFGLLLLLAVPNLDPAARTEQLDETVRRMKTLVALCRAQAMNDSVVYRITFELDGTVSVQRQLDPITAPDQFIDVPPNWSDLDYVLDEVWIAELQSLPDGPAPILVQDDEIEFDPNQVLDPVPIEQIEQPLTLDFDPDGSCSSFRWILRDKAGRGMMMTLDGRLGRIAVEPMPIVEGLKRPEQSKEVKDERAKRALMSEQLRQAALKSGGG